MDVSLRLHRFQYSHSGEARAPPAAARLVISEVEHARVVLFPPFPLGERRFVVLGKLVLSDGSGLGALHKGHRSPTQWPPQQRCTRRGVGARQLTGVACKSQAAVPVSRRLRELSLQGP